MAKNTQNFLKEYKVMCLGLYANCNAEALKLKHNLLLEEIEVVSEYLNLINNGNPYTDNGEKHRD